MERFASELRALRALAGEPPFWKMARRCAVSKSALADAAAGRRLPSQHVTREFVRVCGGDWSWWRDRWSQVSAELATPTDADATDQSGGALAVPSTTALSVLKNQVTHNAAPEQQELLGWPRMRTAHGTIRRPRRFSPRFWLHSLAMATAGAAIVVAAQNAPRLLKDSPTSADRQVNAEHSPSPQLHAVPGDDKDPRDTGCDADAKTVGLADINIYRPGRTVIGQAITRYSPACKAAWARFEPTKALNRFAPHAHITLVTMRPTDHRRVTYSGPYEDVFMWGNMLLTTTGCVTATVTISDPALKPPATASTPCTTG
ncbi:DUF2690 domain-containing protein [Actinoallomurus sp. NPDC052274]|uniref:DUF2690 domain-containing protein n=1 Tax=Actinoallomurus sp. NPDC052274 TaxID=3155420 RepID=UPI00342C26B3